MRHLAISNKFKIRKRRKNRDTQGKRWLLQESVESSLWNWNRRCSGKCTVIFCLSGVCMYQIWLFLQNFRLSRLDVTFLLEYWRSKEGRREFFLYLFWIFTPELNAMKWTSSFMPSTLRYDLPFYLTQFRIKCYIPHKILPHQKIIFFS